MDNSNNKTKRIKEIDFIKGVLILLVYLDHSVLYYPLDFRAEYLGCKIISNFTSSFFMQCFFIVSGFLFYSNNKSYFLVLKDKIKRLAVPYIFICGISLCVKFANPSLAYVSKSSLSDYLYYYLFDGGDRWFVYALFGIFLFVAPVKRFIVQSTFSIIATILLVYTILDTNVLSSLPAIPLFLDYGRYFLLGFLVKKYYSSIRSFLRTNWINFSLLFLIFNVILSNLYKDRFFSLVLPIIGSVSLLAICIKYCDTQCNQYFTSCVNRVGRYSLQFYMLNGCILMPLRFLLVNIIGIVNPWFVVPFLFVSMLVIAHILVRIFERFKLTKILLGY